MFKKLILLLSLMTTLCGHYILLGQSQIEYIPLISTDPKDNIEDLSKLSRYFSGVKLVGMGESTHGTHEFFTMRQRMFRYLVEHHGFNTFFLEADYSLCLRVDRYIKGGAGNPEEVTKEIGLWPWKTKEMANLIEWMRQYNQENPYDMLSFIGCDIQKFKSTVDEIDKIILKYIPENIDTSYYQYMNDKDFIVLKDEDEFASYRKVVRDKKALMDKAKFSNADKEVYQLLIRHLNQIVEEKYNMSYFSYRDVEMGNNILFHFKRDYTIKGFFWAHNQHIFNIKHSSQDNPKAYDTAGGVLKKKLGKEYLAIAQEFDSGSFNAYIKTNKSGDNEDLNNYELREITVELSSKNTLGAKFRDTRDSILYIPAVNFVSKNDQYLKIHDVGAVFTPSKKNKNQVARFGSCRGCYDAMILIKKTSATKLLK